MDGLGIVGYAIQTVRDDHHRNYLITTDYQGEKVSKEEKRRSINAVLCEVTSSLSFGALQKSREETRLRCTFYTRGDLGFVPQKRERHLVHKRLLGDGNKLGHAGT
ncbi:hypothetical protein MRB53_004733 [Persea americana]|uniref:Uncharacterized protein n=1 Tax=Persea americana TaxID=3435 RepID=A0ACC2MBD5_PERAE|nr:hypothetical protein MRB53_004733 [Persea americana]